MRKVLGSYEPDILTLDPPLQRTIASSLMDDLRFVCGTLMRLAASAYVQFSKIVSEAFRNEFILLCIWNLLINVMTEVTRIENSTTF